MAFALAASQAVAATLALWDSNSFSPDADATTGTRLPSAGAVTAALVGDVTGSFTATNSGTPGSPSR